MSRLRARLGPVTLLALTYALVVIPELGRRWP